MIFGRRFFPPGYYIYIEASGQNKGSKAHLVSKQLDSASLGKCVTFWFHMYGPDIDRLNILKRVGSKDMMVWTRRGNQGTDWMYGQVFMTGTYAVSSPN